MAARETKAHTYCRIPSSLEHTAFGDPWSKRNAQCKPPLNGSIAVTNESRQKVLSSRRSSKMRLHKKTKRGFKAPLSRDKGENLAWRGSQLRQISRHDYGGRLGARIPCIWYCAGELWNHLFQNTGISHSQDLAVANFHIAGLAKVLKFYTCRSSPVSPLTMTLPIPSIIAHRQAWNIVVERTLRRRLKE